MRCKGAPPNANTFISSLKACRDRGALDQGREIHAEVCMNGALDGHGDGDINDDVLGNTLLDMYAKFGLLQDARYVFVKLPVKSTISFNTLIVGYIRCGLGEEALKCFESMQSNGLCPSTVSYACTLKACGMAELADKGRKLHSDICIKGLETDIFVGNSLVFMYGDCGMLMDAQKVFDTLKLRDIVSWNALMGGYAKHGHAKEALECFSKVQCNGIIPDFVTFLCALKACREMVTSIKGIGIHMEIFKRALDKDISIGSTLVDFYVSHGLFVEAHQVFEKLPCRNVVTWNVIISGYTKHELGEQAIDCFNQMQLDGIHPNRATFIFVLKACICVASIDKGIEMHGEVARRGLEGDLLLGSTLIDMYANSRSLAKAHEVFERVPIKSIISWTSLISGYAENGFGLEALKCFENMGLHGVAPNNVTFICSLKACGNIGSVEKVKEMHAEIAKCGWLERDVVVGNALVDAYAKCGFLWTARQIFKKLLTKDEVLWNMLLLGYVNHGYTEDVLVLFEQMQLEKVLPSSITFSCCLKVCGTLGAIQKGQEMHHDISKNGLLEGDPLLGNALIEMYARCGFLLKAQEVFDNLFLKDCIVSWNALIFGYAEQGDWDKVHSLFDMMVYEERISPDTVTFLSLLGACSHTGLIEKSYIYLRAMYDNYGITPTLEHYACFIDILSRASQIDMVVIFVEKIPFQPNCVLWHIVLNACRKLGHMELGKETFEHVMELNEMDDAAHVSLSNIYADLQMHNNAIEVQAMRVKKASNEKKLIQV